MLSKFISQNDKVELQAIDRGEEENGENTKKVYYSSVLEILSGDTLEIAMPMEQSKLILLPVDSEYDLVFYGGSGLYQCFARIIDRYKSNNVFILVVELTSNLRKFQRREYYRFSCALEMCARNLEEDEIQAIEKRLPYALVSGRPLKQSVIVDISGGGLRFISSQKYEPDNLLYCSYQLIRGTERKQYEVIGKVLSAKEVENRPGFFEHRVQYYDIDKEMREEIIKYIFEEERKSLQKERN
ncbi:MAG: flagellar brake protein [Lachnospiraceae bacterium]|jgi:c-di-GMP-binding flagellar brake protein YcgR|nr:flagellar brake protein [Lachnospiraceae bacterium]MCI9674451.1 flagellar brake protein [Lachnospiraceae bacterium]